MFAHLPTPLELSMVAGALGLAAAAAMFLLSSVRLCAYLAAAAMIVGLCASVAYGYEKMGEDKIQPQLDACVADVKRSVAEGEAFKLASANAVTAATTKYKAVVAQLRQANAAFEDLLHAQDPSVSGIRIPAAAGQLLQPAIDAVNAGLAAVPGAGRGATAAATVAADTDLGAVEEWAGQVVALYGTCTAQVRGLQGYVADLVNAAAKQKGAVAP